MVNLVQVRMTQKGKENPEMVKDLDLREKKEKVDQEKVDLEVLECLGRMGGPEL